MYVCIFNKCVAIQYIICCTSLDALTRVCACAPHVRLSIDRGRCGSNGSRLTCNSNCSASSMSSLLSLLPVLLQLKRLILLVRLCLYTLLASLTHFLPLSHALLLARTCSIIGRPVNCHHADTCNVDVAGLTSSTNTATSGTVSVRAAAAPSSRALPSSVCQRKLDIEPHPRIPSTPALDREDKDREKDDTLVEKEGVGQRTEELTRVGGYEDGQEEPRCWRQVRSSSSGKLYWYNTRTGVTQWQLPTACGPASASCENAAKVCSPKTTLIGSPLSQVKDE